MLKGDIVDKLCEDMTDLSKADAILAVDIILETMTRGLVKGQRVEIRGFGSLSPRQRQPKTAKNPKSGAIMHIPLRNTIHFTMSKFLKYPLIKK